MKRIAILLLSLMGVALTSSAQTFTQHLRQQQTGKGKITITQTKEIDNLVNGNVSETVSPQQKTPTQPVKTAPQTVKTTPQSDRTAKSDSLQKLRDRQKAEEEKKKQAEKANEDRRAIEEAIAMQKRATEKATDEKTAEEKRQAAERSAAEKRAAEEAAEDELHIPTVDMRKKVMRGAHKVTGYRVQAFAGGNTRADKIKAQQAGNAIKMRFPDQPIYVHFYSPRWICRVGNYRTLGEAEQMLHSVKALGYKSAIIVKGKITVFN